MDDARYLALALANQYPGETIDQTMARAKKYLKFLTTDAGTTTADPGTVLP